MLKELFNKLFNKKEEEKEVEFLYLEDAKANIHKIEELYFVEGKLYFKLPNKEPFEIFNIVEGFDTIIQIPPAFKPYLKNKYGIVEYYFGVLRIGTLKYFSEKNKRVYDLQNSAKEYLASEYIKNEK